MTGSASCRHREQVQSLKRRGLLGSLATAPLGIFVVLLANCQGTPSKITPYEPASPQAQQVIDRYLADVRGRYGALAISADGSRAAYHICLYRALTNCDNLNHFNSSWTLSSRVAAWRAMSRCGGGCRLLYLNEKRQG